MDALISFFAQLPPHGVDYQLVQHLEIQIFR